MYGDDDLDAAVEAGIVPAQTARAFRDFVARRHSTTPVDEEHFRLLTSFNDIFVAVAIVLVLTAAGWLGSLVSPILAPLLVAGASWGLAEYFTRRRRMALPSILLLLSFVGAVFFLAIAVLVGGTTQVFSGGAGLGTIGAGIAAALGAYGHWRRFQVPITVAAGVLALLGSLIVVAAQRYGDLFGLGAWPVMLACGLSVFALAMVWDASDRHRSTRRSDVAFWLHLAAAPLIVHPVFSALGLLDGNATAAHAAIAVVLYLALALVALAVDRRALLISALVYVLYAIATLLKGTVDESFGLTALVLGSGLLLLSASWHRARGAVVGVLPAALQARLPVV